MSAPPAHVVNLLEQRLQHWSDRESLRKALHWRIARENERKLHGANHDERLRGEGAEAVLLEVLARLCGGKF